MKNKLLISLVFLLIPYIGICQTGTTVYPFSGEQVRTMAHVRLAYENVLEQNKTLYEMITWSDSVKDMQMNTIVALDGLLIIKEDQIENQKVQLGLERDKFELADGLIKKERKVKWVFVGISVGLAGLLTLSLL